VTPSPGVAAEAASTAAAGAGESPSREQGNAIAAAADALVGTPYHFGGADEAGFDCSGLALYVHERVGLSIPRTAAEQQRAARPVQASQILPGDLLFFRMRKHGIDHVGIYLGDGRFVHAPHAGRAVAAAELGSDYYARHFVAAGRFWEPNPPP
jgi:cell wall-associated NlpC family hydrolase